MFPFAQVVCGDKEFRCHQFMLAARKDSHLSHTLPHLDLHATIFLEAFPDSEAFVTKIVALRIRIGLDSGPGKQKCPQ
jgi:hypothetical protein